MLACRPMLFIAGMIMAGALTERSYELAARFWFCGVGVVLLSVLWFVVKKPVQEPVVLDTLPDEYRAHIQPVPGFFARRGINRFMLVLGVAVFFLGMARQHYWREKLEPGRLPAQRWFNAGFVADAPSHFYPGQRGGVSIPARLIAVGGEQVPDVPVRLRCNEFVAFRRGDIVQGRVQVWKDSPTAFPGAFDFMLFRERSGLVGTVNALTRGKGAAQALKVIPIDFPPLRARVWRAIDDIRGLAIQRTLAYGGEFGGLLAAMLFGYRQDIGDSIRDAFRRVGIGHVLAISGLHVGLIVGMFWWLGGWIGCAAQWRALICLMLSVFFWSLTGGQVAATRATVMAVIHLAGVARGRRADMLNSLGAAACFITLQNPSAPLDLSFQLSFLAVVFIYMTLKSAPAPEPERRTPDPRYNAVLRRRFRWQVYSLFRLSVATWIGLFPLIAFAFKQVNPAGLPINIIAIPLMSLVLAGGVLVPWLGWLPGVGWILTFPARMLTLLAGIMDTIPGSSFPVHPPGWGWVVLAYVAVAAWMLAPVIGDARLRWRWTKYCRYAIAASVLAVLVSMRTLSPPTGGRIALLPGSGFGVVAAEAPNGEVALIGKIRGGGLNEAMWLHSLHRRGTIAVLGNGNVAADSLSALSWHYPLEMVTGIQNTRKAEASTHSGWMPVPGTTQIEYALARDGAGRMNWLAVRTGKVMIAMAPRMAVNTFVDYVKRGFPGADAQLFSVYFTDADSRFPPDFVSSGWIAAKGRIPKNPPFGVFGRSEFGTLRLDGELAGFDGRTWKRFLHASGNAQ